MTLEVNYELANFHDKFLRWMIGQTQLADRLEVSPLARELNTTLVNEQLRRLKVRAGEDAETVTLTLPPMSYEQACEAAVELTEDSHALVPGIAAVESSEPELAAILREGVAFLNSIAEALKSYAKIIKARARARSIESISSFNC